MSSEIPGYRDKCIDLDPSGEGEVFFPLLCSTFVHPSKFALPFQKLLLIPVIPLIHVIWGFIVCDVRI